MKRKLFLLLTAFLLCASLLAATQKFLPRTIHFNGDPEYSDQDLLAAAGLQAGVELTAAETNRHAQQLLHTGLFASISFKLYKDDLVFTVAPTRLYAMRLENLPLTPGKELDAALHDRIPLYRGKVPGTGGVTEQVRQALEEMLAARGIKATVAEAAYGDPRLHKVAAVTYSILSPPVRVGEIHLEGVSAAMEDNVRLTAGRETGTAFDTENSEKNLEQAIESIYADKDYAAARVHASRSGDPVATAVAIEVPFSVTVEEGRIYRLGSVHLPSNALVTQAEIDRAFNSDFVAPAKGPVLRTTSFMIAARYKSKGYLDCTVTSHPEFDETAGVVNYTFAVDPGPVYRLATVKFENVSDSVRRRLLRAWKMLPRAPFDESYLSDFAARAKKNDPVLGRALAGMTVDYDVTADPQTHGVKCVLRFTKAQPAP
jgi:outer membrane protein insertion porin family